MFTASPVTKVSRARLTGGDHFPGVHPDTQRERRGLRIACDCLDSERDHEGVPHRLRGLAASETAMIESPMNFSGPPCAAMTLRAIA
jgi:hypothetical protein